MICFRTSNNAINKVHEWALRIVLNNHTSDFKTLLQNINEVCNHYRNIQALLTKKWWEPMDENRCLKEWMRIDVWKDKYHLQIQKFQESEKERKKNCIFWFRNINPFAPNVPFLCPLKISESVTVLWCFQGVDKG